MFHYVEEHPYLSGGLVVGLVILFVVIRRSAESSSGGSVVSAGGPSESLQAAGISAGAQLQATQIAANVQISGYNAQVNLAEIMSAADVVKTGMAYNLELERIYQTVDVTKYTTDASLKLGLAQLGIGVPAPAYVPQQAAPSYSYGVANQYQQQQQVQQSQQDQIYSGLTSTTPRMPTTPCTGASRDVGEQWMCSQRNVAAVNFNEQIPFDPIANIAKYGGYNTITGTDPASLAAQKEYMDAHRGY